MATALYNLLAEDFHFSDDGMRRFIRSCEHDSLVYDKEKNKFYWNSKGIHGDAFTYLTLVRGVSPEDASKILRQTTPEVPMFETTSEKQVKTSPELVNIFYDLGKNVTDYWKTVRGYTQETIDKFKLGFTGMWYTIPIFEDGKFANFQLRKIKEGKKVVRPWYRGTGPQSFNFSILNLTDWAVLTEGPVDAIMLRQNDIPAISHTTGAGTWKPEWNKYFSKIKRLYIVYDNDDAGVKGAVKIGKVFGNRSRIFNFWDFPSKYDCTDYFKEWHPQIAVSHHTI